MRVEEELQLVKQGGVVHKTWLDLRLTDAEDDTLKKFYMRMTWCDDLVECSHVSWECDLPPLDEPVTCLRCLSVDDP